jgi:hypothetical protein
MEGRAAMRPGGIVMRGIGWIVSMLAVTGSSLVACKDRSDSAPAAPASAASSPATATASAASTATSPLTKVASPDAAEKAKVEKFTADFLGHCKTKQFAALGDDATPELQKGLTPAVQKSVCASFDSKFGEFKSMDFVSEWKGMDGKRVYRFRAAFSKAAIGATEVRGIVGTDGKITKVDVLPWEDTIYYDKL